MAEEKSIINGDNVNDIVKAKPEDIEAFETMVLETDKVLNQCTDNLSDLNESLKALYNSKVKYDEVSSETKKRMRRLNQML